MPGLQRGAQTQVQARTGQLANEREAKLEVRCKPLGAERKTSATQLGHHVFKVHLNEGRQHVAVVQRRAPSRQTCVAACFVRFTPKPGHQSAQQQLLGQAHVGMRWHLKSAQLQETQAARAAVG